MLVIDLDTTLKQNRPWESNGYFTQENKIDCLISRQKKKTDSLCRTVVQQHTTTHTNYLAYVKLCWQHHWGIVISPDYLWHVVMCEIAEHVKQNSDYYRNKFTTSSEKEMIVVLTGDPEVLPLHSIVAKLDEKVPSDISAFIPKFSTSTELSQFVFKAAFADAVSPYYSYGMKLCGIPKVKILGCADDWKLFQKNISLLKGILDKSDMIEYFKGVSEGIDNISTIYNLNTASIPAIQTIWKQFFKAEECGSGSQYVIDGWITKFFKHYNKDSGVLDVNDFSTCVSIVNYKNLDTDKIFNLYAGLFTSKENEGFLEPDFGYFVCEHGDKEVVEKPTEEPLKIELTRLPADPIRNRLVGWKIYEQTGVVYTDKD
jgi:hypothetical protein